MCTNCGCAVTPSNVGIYDHDHDHNHAHDHDHNHAHDHDHNHAHDHDHNHAHDDRSHTHTIDIHAAIFAKNQRLAERNRGYLWAKGLFTINLVSSPGSGKTSVIERTVTDLKSKITTAVIVGDLATDNDAQRLRKTGVTALQITTGDICHLEAEMVGKALTQISLDGVQLLIIENVGNLVCPAAYDLGEDLRVAIFSVTEGEDKPLKYPTMFKSAQIVLINKIDIAEVVGFDRPTAIQNIQRVAPQAKILEVSAKTGAGMNEWYQYLESQIKQVDRTLFV